MMKSPVTPLWVAVPDEIPLAEEENDARHVHTDASLAPRARARGDRVDPPAAGKPLIFVIISYMARMNA